MKKAHKVDLWLLHAQVRARRHYTQMHAHQEMIPLILLYSNHYYNKEGNDSHVEVPECEV